MVGVMVLLRVIALLLLLILLALLGGGWWVFWGAALVVVVGFPIHTIAAIRDARRPRAAAAPAAAREQQGARLPIDPEREINDLEREFADLFRPES
jgi:hypothetical protein